MQTQMENVCVTEWYNGILFFYIKRCHQIIKSILGKDYAEPLVGKKTLIKKLLMLNIVRWIVFIVRQNKIFFCLIFVS